MTTTASTSTTNRTRLQMMLHLRQGEKLGREPVSFAILFPAAAFHDPQGQEQKEQRQAAHEDDWPRVHHAAHEVMHLLEEVETGKRLSLPGSGDGEAVDEPGEHVHAHAEAKADHRGDALASCGRRSAASQRDK